MPSKASVLFGYQVALFVSLNVVSIVSAQELPQRAPADLMERGT